MLLSEVIQDYTQFMREENAVSAHTLRSHESDLRQFLKYSKNIAVSSVAPDVLSGYFLMLSDEKKAAPATIMRRWSTINSFFSHCKKQGLIPENPFSGLSTPVKLDQQPPAILTRAEVRRLLAVPGKEVVRLRKELDRRIKKGIRIVEVEKNLYESVRNRAIMELLFATGIRVGELIGLKENHFDFNSRTVLINDGKGERRLGYFPSEIVYNSVQEYADIRRTYAVDIGGGFFINRNGNTIRPETVRKIVRGYADSAKIGKTVTPYTLRHTLAVMLLDSGSDLNSIQELLGSISSALVHLAAGRSRPSIQTVLKKADPRSR